MPVSISMVDCFIFVAEACTTIICAMSVSEGFAPGFSRFTVVYTNPNTHCILNFIKLHRHTYHCDADFGCCS